MTCTCRIIPEEVLGRFANDKKLSAAERTVFKNSLALEPYWRQIRAIQTELSGVAAMSLAGPGAVPSTPAITVNDCHHTTTLPGTPVSNPGSSSDATAKRAFAETTQVVKFYKTVFSRNSVDNQGMTLGSSVHFGVKYNNAFWNGTRMTYGDGDGNIFVDFTRGPDVIAHELTHGVTQHSAQLAYVDQAGGLNESMSDVFGSMFRQWEKGQDVNAADWLIGKEIMGPGAIQRGLTCLRDMANPGASHCLAPQPTNFSQYHDGMDPHFSSGPPNLAFYKAARAVGGKSWEKTGQIWYRALTGYAPKPNLTMKEFANRTRSLAQTLYPGTPAIKLAVDNAWKAVGL